MSELYSWSRYWTLITMKTAFYTFWLPLACGLIVSGVGGEDLARTKAISMELGQFFQGGRFPEKRLSLDLSTDEKALLCYFKRIEKASPCDCQNLVEIFFSQEI